MKHIMLGAGGSISKVLTEELLADGQKIKLVSRKGFSIEGAESAKADLTDKESAIAAIEKSSTVYLLVGLPYNLEIWRRQWPLIMKNVVEACEQKNARLVFFDNIYAYGRVDGNITEDRPYKPSSKKGEIRARIADYLMGESGKGNVKAMIARAADFYGPYSEKTSLPFVFYFSRLAAGKRAWVLANADKKHSYTYTGDCGKALHLLGTADDVYDQVWHLPTAAPALTGKEFIKIVAAKIGVEPNYSVLKSWIIRLSGLFDRDVKEVYEMLYQNRYDYIFDSSKFEKRFGFKPTPYESGIEKTVASLAMKGKK